MQLSRISKCTHGMFARSNDVELSKEILQCSCHFIDMDEVLKSVNLIEIETMARLENTKVLPRGNYFICSFSVINFLWKTKNYLE